MEVQHRWFNYRAALRERETQKRASSPIPVDPIVSFEDGWKRAIEKPGTIETIYRAVTPPAPKVRRTGVICRSPRNMMRNSPAASANRSNLERFQQFVRREIEDFETRREVPRREEVQRRPLSPTELPGVRAIPKEYNGVLKNLLIPGEFFAKSHTRYLGPFEHEPAAESLPAHDNYIILQRMGRLPDCGKSIFRQVGNVIT